MRKYVVVLYLLPLQNWDAVTFAVTKEGGTTVISQL